MFGWNNLGYAQKSLEAGLRFGNLHYEDWNFKSGTIELNGNTNGIWNSEFYVQKPLAKGFKLRLTGGVMRSKESIRFKSIEPQVGSARYNNFLLGIGGHKYFNLVKEKFGLNLGVGLGLNYLNSSDRTFDTDRTAQIIVIEVIDQDGNVIRKPLHDLTMNGSRTVTNPVSFIIKPEIGFFYALSNKTKLTLNYLHGINMGGPVVSRNLGPIIYEGNTYTAMDEFGGDFSSFALGIEVKLK